MTFRTTVQSIYDAYAARDLETALSYFAPNMRFDWPENGDLRWCGCCEGIEAFTARLMDLDQHCEFLSYKLTNLLVDGDRAAAQVAVEVRFKATGEVVTSRMAHFWRFEDGKAVKLTEDYDTALVHKNLA